MESYKAALESARQELQQLIRQHEQLDLRIAQVLKMVRALVPLVEGEAVTADMAALTHLGVASDETAPIVVSDGITTTAQIKQVFELHYSAPLTPIEVREGLKVMGWNPEKHANPMATIHAGLKRLVEQGWLIPADKDGKSAYERIREIAPAIAGKQIDDALKRKAAEMRGASKEELQHDT
jgi:hypothetical protein